MIGLLVFVGALQLSIAVAGIVLAFTLGCWAVFAVVHQERCERAAVLLAAAGLRAADAGLGGCLVRQRASFIDSKQLVLFLIVPVVYQFARGTRAMTVLQVIITVGAASAAWGIVQYGLFNYDNLGQRPQGALGHYMTYSGLLLLVVGAAVARLLFEPRNRMWPAMVMPALARRARADLHPQRLGRRLRRGGAALRAEGLPPAAGDSDRRGGVLRVSPPQITARFYSMFDLNDPTSRDRVAMLHEGVAMIKAHPLTASGPNMVQRLYAQYRDPTAVEKVNPHLHNVPMQIAAERGLPALAVWLVLRRDRRGRPRAAAPAEPLPLPRRQRRSPRSPACWPPGCSNTTSATRSS